MSDIKDGGSVFPKIQTKEEDSSIWQNTSFSNISSSGGMSLRDWFAGMAMQGFCSATDQTGQWAWTEISAPRMAYKLADEMLAARKKSA